MYCAIKKAARLSVLVYWECSSPQKKDEASTCTLRLFSMCVQSLEDLQIFEENVKAKSRSQSGGYVLVLKNSGSYMYVHADRMGLMEHDWRNHILVLAL